MKFIPSFLLLFFFSFTASQAQKCEYNYNEKGLKKIMVSLSKQTQVWLNNDNGKLSLALELTYAEIRKEKISKGDTLILVIGDADFVPLTCAVEALPVGKADDRVEMTNYFPSYNISAELAEKLNRNPLTALRVSFGKDNNTIEMEPKKAKKIMEAAGCIRK